MQTPTITHHPFLTNLMLAHEGILSDIKKTFKRHCYKTDLMYFVVRFRLISAG